MIALGTAFMVTRLAIRTIKRRFFIAEEIAITIGWACMVAVCAGYISVAPTVYRISAAARGDTGLYSSPPEDALLLRKIFFANTLLFWSALWGVKISLLFQCKRLVERQDKATLVWWCILGVTVLSYIGCLISQLTACGTMSAWWQWSMSIRIPTHVQCTLANKFEAGCLGPDSVRRAAIGLYYSFAVDVITDLMSKSLLPAV
jgi:hypothetical protein